MRFSPGYGGGMTHGCMAVAQNCPDLLGSFVADSKSLRCFFFQFSKAYKPGVHYLESTKDHLKAI